MSPPDPDGDTVCRTLMMRMNPDFEPTDADLNLFIFAEQGEKKNVIHCLKHSCGVDPTLPLLYDRGTTRAAENSHLIDYVSDSSIRQLIVDAQKLCLACRKVTGNPEAVKKNTTELRKVLEELKENGTLGDLIDMKDSANKNRSVLHVAVREGCPETVQFLLQNNANRFSRDAFGDTPKALAERFRHNRVEEFQPVIDLLNPVGSVQGDPDEIALDEPGDEPGDNDYKDINSSCQCCTVSWLPSSR